MNWLVATEHLCHKWSRICSTCRKHFPVLSSSITYHRTCLPTKWVFNFNVSGVLRFTV